MAAEIHSVFPTPVMKNAFFGPFTSKEKKFIEQQQKNVFENDYNDISIDKTVLDYHEMLRIKTFIQENVDEYLKKIVCADDNVSLRITQSWMNFTETGRSHHTHSHPNSYISGVFYINADREVDRIQFLQNEYKQLVINPTEFNLWNSTSWWFPVGTNDLILFPSALTHMVEPTKSKETRISLSFNTFPVGCLGAVPQANFVKL
jgi:uncharacterized protein (TIGR02466 family)